MRPQWLKSVLGVGSSLLVGSGGLVLSGEALSWATSTTLQQRSAATDADSPPTVAEILLVSGSVHRTGDVELSRLTMLPSGYADAGSPGPLSIAVLGCEGTVLNRITFDVVFRLMSDAPRDVDEVPIAFAVTYPLEACALRVESRNGQKTVFIGPRLVRDALSRVSDLAFGDGGPELRRSILRDATAIEAALNVLDWKAVTAALNNARRTAARWAETSAESAQAAGARRVVAILDDLLLRSAWQLRKKL